MTTVTLTKERHFTGAGLVSEAECILLTAGSMAGRHGAGDIAERSTYILVGSRKRVRHGA